MLFAQLPRTDTGCLAYAVGDPETREAVIVDPPEELGPVLAAAARLGIAVSTVLETHTHADHLSGARALAERTGARLLLPSRSSARFAHESVADGADVRVGELRMRALHTPGHTPDAMCLVLRDRVLVGDTLLVGSAGRADFYPEGPEEMYHSLFERILKLADELLVFPAHYGPKHGLPEKLMTTLGEERRVNEALTQETKEDFVRYMTEGWPPKPSAWERIVEANTRA